MSALKKKKDQILNRAESLLSERNTFTRDIKVVKIASTHKKQ